MKDDRQAISKLDKYFNSPELSKQIKKLIFLERVTLISIIANIVSSHLYEMLEESIRTVEIILGFWFQILNNTYNSNIFKLESSN